MVKTPLKSSSFELDSSGVAGFFGGDEAVSAMGVVHLYAGRRWLGWYNAPGSYEIAKKYGQLARSRFWDGLFPGVNVEPEELFELDGEKGPSYNAWNSGTHIDQTTHIGYLFLKECEEFEAEKVQGRETTPYGVTIVTLECTPEKNMCPPSLRTHASLFAAIPMSASIAACVACGLIHDWFSFSMILLGILCSGISSFVIGSGVLHFEHPEAAEGSPEGDGVLMDKNEVVILLGPENAVNCVTRGRFSLKFNRWFHRMQSPKEREYRSIGLCSLLLIFQFLAQLLLIPQGELFGQIMFLASLGVSWGYNLYLSSLDKEVIQRRILMQNVLREPKMKKYSLGTRTTMAVFLALVYDSKHLRNLASRNRQESLSRCLLDIISNDTGVWSIWREAVTSRISRGEVLAFVEKDWNIGTEADTLLKYLYQDANTAQVAFSSYEAYDASGSPSGDKTRNGDSVPDPVSLRFIGSNDTVVDSTGQIRGKVNVV